MSRLQLQNRGDRGGMLTSRAFSAFNKMKLSVRNILPTGKTHSGTLIFLHGSGDTGGNLVEWIRFLLAKDLAFPHIKVVVPTAPLQPYTPLDGEMSNVWFDRAAISQDADECRPSLEKAYEYVKDLIATEEAQGIAADRIVVGGFSMGGCLAMHTGFHVNQRLAGVFACSSFLNNGSVVYEALAATADPKKLPKMLMFHGTRDTLVPLEWARSSWQQLQRFGVDGDFRILQNTFHELKVTELNELREWTLKILPPLENDLGNKL